MNVSRNLPDTDDFLRILGLVRARHDANWPNGVAVFAAGMLVGAGLALLFAPASGAQMREQIGARLDEVRDRVASGGDAGARADAPAAR